MDEIVVDLTNNDFSNDRVDLRIEIINIFLDENPGTGRGNLTSRYKYITKVLSGGNEVFLKRPANFNNGFDFIVNVSGINFNEGIPNGRASMRPTHGNILEDLRVKKQEDEDLYNELKEQIDFIYNCESTTETNFAFTLGHPTDLLLECIKWLFVEQDVTYWNYSGRTMLFNAINEI